MIADCLAKLKPAHAEWASALQPGDVATITVLLGGIVAALWAPWLLRSYGRTVIRFMGFRQVTPPPDAWWQRRMRLLHRPAARAAPPSSSGTLTDAMRLRESRIRRATAAAFVVFMLGGALVFLLDEGDSMLAYANMVLLVAVLAAGPAVVNLMPEGSTRWLLGGIALVMVVSGTVEVALGISEPLEVVGGMLLVLCVLAICLHRRLRALFVPLTVLGGAGVLGVVAASGTLLPLVCVSDPDALTGADGWLAIGVLAAAVFAFGLCLWAGVQLLSGLARLHERGFVSDLSLVSGSGALIVAALAAFSADAPGTSVGTMTLAWLAWAAAAVATYVLVLFLQPQPVPSASLLVLRVFSKDKKSERLLDAVQTRWRYAGPVLQIGGPDLAKLNIDPYELVKFVTFKTHELFLPGQVTQEQLLASLDLDADREGRFRVNEVFCFDTAWRSTVEQLMDLSDAILLDLRGFQAQRAGTAFEITRLAAPHRLARVVAIGDEVTDWAHVDKLFGRATRDASSREQRLDAKAPDLARRCLEALARVAMAGKNQRGLKECMPPPV